MLPKETKRGGEITELEKLGAAAVVVTSEIVVVRHGVRGGVGTGFPINKFGCSMPMSPL